jgi:hypothetical protein
MNIQPSLASLGPMLFWGLGLWCLTPLLTIFQLHCAFLEKILQTKVEK